MINLDEYKNIYICGPITGMDDLNRPAFKEASDMFRNMRGEKLVYNPHELVPLSLVEKHIHEPKKLWTECMKICIRAVTRVDAVFVLDGWESSRGATVEIFTAQTLSIPVFYYKTMQPMQLSFQLIKYPKGFV